MKIIKYISIQSTDFKKKASETFVFPSLKNENKPETGFTETLPVFLSRSMATTIRPSIIHAYTNSF